jgi:hypothetical protein
VGSRVLVVVAHGVEGMRIREWDNLLAVRYR